MDEKVVHEMVEKMKKVLAPIDAVDKNGRQLHVLEALHCEGSNNLIMWSMFSGDYVAMSEHGAWLTRENMVHGEYVLFNQENDWTDVYETIGGLDEKAAESVVRLITSHYNMNALFEGAMQALKEIAKTTKDEETRELTEERVAFIKSLIPRDES